MATSLAELRQKLKDQENKRTAAKTGGGGDKTSYPFWDMQENETAILRFIPDANPENTFFWVEKQQIRIPFQGIEGVNSKPTTVTVPCMEMWNETCPIHQEIRPWFKDPSMADMARTYWKKRSYIFQGFVRKSPLQENDLPENPIRKFTFGSQIFNLVKAALLDPEMENIPTDYINGTDFQITKLMKGQYADYATSKWARKESSLTDDELQAIAQYGAFDLSKSLPAKPDGEALNAIFEMFEASIEGKAYDPERWGKYYKPYGIEIANTDKSTSSSSSVQVPSSYRTESVVRAPAPAAEPAAQPSVSNYDLPWQDEQTATSQPSAPQASTTAAPATSAQDIIAMIRARSQGN